MATFLRERFAFEFHAVVPRSGDFTGSSRACNGLLPLAAGRTTDTIEEESGRRARRPSETFEGITIMRISRLLATIVLLMGVGAASSGQAAVAIGFGIGIPAYPYRPYYRPYYPPYRVGVYVGPRPDTTIRRRYIRSCPGVCRSRLSGTGVRSPGVSATRTAPRTVLLPRQHHGAVQHRAATDLCTVAANVHAAQPTYTPSPEVVPPPPTPSTGSNG